MSGTDPLVAEQTLLEVTLSVGLMLVLTRLCHSCRRGRKLCEVSTWRVPCCCRLSGFLLSPATEKRPGSCLPWHQRRRFLDKTLETVLKV